MEEDGRMRMPARGKRQETDPFLRELILGTEVEHEADPELVAGPRRFSRRHPVESPAPIDIPEPAGLPVRG
jgi:hypothetical protein